VGVPDGAVVVPGVSLTYSITWAPSDWVSGLDLNALHDCFEIQAMDGTVSALTSLDHEWKPIANTGSAAYTITVPNLALGDKLCDRARLSGTPSDADSASTQKSNSLCFTIGSVTSNDPKITIVKKTIPAGAPDTFKFTGQFPASLKDGQSEHVVVEPGTYRETELDTPGWKLVSISCDDSDSTGDVGSSTATFKVAAGESVVCTFTNQKQTTSTGGSGGSSGGSQGSGTPTKVKGKRIGLPSTGEDGAGLLAAALIFMTAGAHLVLVRRRPREL
jgi:hypothetical protein